ncbi:Hypothetical predicted protein [Octopus vulgaris]|uniref:Uncharacterized protein n=1 Tax=Octopus vulgaris TaxID=6645 RepID=A0AA36FEB5_OCTVU|nr:Hypothetical predicted protein [Octopus vulgaris]
MENFKMLGILSGARESNFRGQKIRDQWFISYRGHFIMLVVKTPNSEMAQFTEFEIATVAATPVVVVVV